MLEEKCTCNSILTRNKLLLAYTESAIAEKMAACSLILETIDYLQI